MTEHKNLPGPTEALAEAGRVGSAATAGRPNLRRFGWPDPADRIQRLGLDVVG